MSLLKASNQLKWAKGVEAGTLVPSDFIAMLLFNGSHNGIKVVFYRISCSCDKEHILTGRQINLNKVMKLLCKLPKVNATGKSNPAVSGQIYFMFLSYVYKRNILIKTGNSIQ